MPALKNSKENAFYKFLNTKLGAILAFVVIFYFVTFAVYYFYGPGPEERRMAEQEKTQSPIVVPQADQISTINVSNTMTEEQAEITQESSTTQQTPVTP